MSVILLWICGVLASANIALLSFVSLTVKSTNNTLIKFVERLAIVEEAVKTIKQDIKELKSLN